jgi:radical SAM superfamily enzyme YgiQ (UPF0313 family)
LISFPWVSLKEGSLRLFLIQPSQILDGGKILKTQKLMFPRLSLPVLASLTPPDVEIRIIDEHFEEIPFEDPVDLVGVSFMTPQAPRAYQIGDAFLKRGKGVVMGGIHASALPEEALKHSDAVVVGEAEEVWPRVLEDFRRKRARGIYRAGAFPSLSGLSSPRYDLLNKDRFRLWNVNFPIQAGRGCPFHCDFCSVTKFFGGEYRWRPVEEVLREILQKKVKGVFFVDDNIIGQKAYARELFQALKPLKIRWGAQASLNIAKDEELLRMAADSGCGILYIGIESISSANLPAHGKSFFKGEEISDHLTRIQNRGILVRASIIFGMDEDGPDVFHHTVNFLKRSKVAYAEFFLLTPMPGTELRRKLEEEGRILENDWSKYDGLHPVFHPRKMDKETLEEGLWRAYQEFYSLPSVLKRCLKVQKANRRWRTILSNFYYRKLVFQRRHPLYGY